MKGASGPAKSRWSPGAEHELEDRLLAGGIGDDLETRALLDEQALMQVGRADRLAVRDGHAQARETGFEIVHARDGS